MNRRVIGSGAVACSAMVLWSQPSAPESQPIPDCDEGATTCMATTARPAQPQPSILPPDIHRAIESLPIDWGGGGGLPDSMESLYASLLEQGQAAASESKLAIALSTVSGIPNNSEHYEEASQLQESWAQQLLERGNSQYQQGDVEAALALLSAIPPTSDRFERAQELQTRWSQQAELLDRAEAARHEGDWRGVMVAIEALEGTPLYDTLPVQQLLQQAIYRAYGSGESLMQLADLPNAIRGTIAAIPGSQPTADAGLPNLPSLPDLPIAVDQALTWAQPMSAPQGLPPAPVPMPIAPSTPPAIAQQPAAMPAPGSVAPPESIATVTLKTPNAITQQSAQQSGHQGIQIDSKQVKAE